MTRVNIWTDGPNSQFKNKYIFALATKCGDAFKLNIEWNYFAALAGHGKGPMMPRWQCQEDFPLLGVIKEVYRVQCCNICRCSSISSDTSIRVSVMDEDEIMQ